MTIICVLLSLYVVIAIAGIIYEIRDFVKEATMKSKKKQFQPSIFEITYKVKTVTLEGKAKTVTKKDTVVAESDKDALIAFAQNGESKQLVSIRKLNVKDIRK